MTKIRRISISNDTDKKLIVITDKHEYIIYGEKKYTGKTSSKIIRFHARRKIIYPTKVEILHNHIIMSDGEHIILIDDDLGKLRTFKGHFTKLNDDIIVCNYSNSMFIKNFKTGKTETSRLELMQEMEFVMIDSEDTPCVVINSSTECFTHSLLNVM